MGSYKISLLQYCLVIFLPIGQNILHKINARREGFILVCGLTSRKGWWQDCERVGHMSAVREKWMLAPSCLPHFLFLQSRTPSHLWSSLLCSTSLSMTTAMQVTLNTIELIMKINQHSHGILCMHFIQWAWRFVFLLQLHAQEGYCWS